MKIITNNDKCTGCKVCVRVCPQKILKVVDNKMEVADESRCMGCFGCEDECKEGAIRLLRAPQDETDVVVEPPPENVEACDVAIVGAGPSGLGAAIACARAGLDVVVFDRLPNRKLSHHTDGGVLFSFPGQTSVVVDGATVSFPELDISIEAEFVRECEHLGLLGPDGLSTQSVFPKGLSGWAGNKDGFVEALVNEAKNSGAQLWYNAKVTNVLRDGDAVIGVQLASGEEISSKVVVCADGCFAKISEKAGMSVNREDLWYAQVLAFEYDNTDNIPAGLFYLNGDLPFDNDIPAAFGGIGITAVIHVLVAFFSRSRYYKAPHPMDHYVAELIAKDPRVRELLGTSLNNVKPDLLTGCRGIFRGACNTEPVGNGVVSVGDAWVDDGEIGNVPALCNGVYAGNVIIEAFRRGDFSRQTLLPVKNFITKRFLAALKKNKQMKLLGTRLDKQEMTEMFRFMQHMNYPVMLLGSPAQQRAMFTRFFFRNFFRFFRYPKITRALF